MLNVLWNCCLSEATIYYSTSYIFYITVFLKCDGMKTGNMMEWNLQMWRNKNQKYDGIIIRNMMERKLKIWRNKIVKYDGIHYNKYEVSIHGKL